MSICDPNDIRITNTATPSSITIGNTAETALPPEFWNKVLPYPPYQLPGQITSKPFKPVPAEYKTRIKSRVSIPIGGLTINGAALEMTVAQDGDQIEFTLLQPGRQAINFTAHRKDLEALFGELTLDKLSK